MSPQSRENLSGQSGNNKNLLKIPGVVYVVSVVVYDVSGVVYDVSGVVYVVSGVVYDVSGVVFVRSHSGSERHLGRYREGREDFWNHLIGKLA